MEHPERLTVLTCIGCGALTEPGTCASGCTEARLDLVPAEDFDRIKAELVRSHGAVAAFRAVAERLATSHPAPQDVERVYGCIQQQARAALRVHPDPGDAEAKWLEREAPTTAWWCSGCGGLDAPQPCQGVCIRRPAEWVNYEVYEHERERALRELDAERRLRQLAREVAFVTPRAGQWWRGWRTAQRWARAARTADSPFTAGRDR